MTVETDADRLAMLQDWGDTAIFGGVTIYGLFDDAFSAVNEGTLAVEDTHPVFHCRESDVPNIAHSNALPVNGVAYTVAGLHPDGQGMIDIVLYKA